MEDFLRSSAAGQLVRLISGKTFLKYPEERDNFEIPIGYSDAASPETQYRHEANDEDVSPPDTSENIEEIPRDSLSQGTETVPDQETLGRTTSGDTSLPAALTRIPTRTDLEKVHTRADLENLYSMATQREELKHAVSRPIAPTKISDGTILVDWYTTDDPENPLSIPTAVVDNFAGLLVLRFLQGFFGSLVYATGGASIRDVYTGPGRPLPRRTWPY
jgi:DHA1 family multidrug resistance protein-like MFS transporter